MSLKPKTNYFDPESLKNSLIEISDKHSDSFGNSSLNSIINSDVKIQILSKRCLDGDYNFSPYSLKLFMKGRGRPPREISIPSLQDQAVLKSLDKTLKTSCAIDNSTKLAFFIVKDLKDFLTTNSDNLKVMRIDIQKYFDEIKHDILLDKIKEKKCEGYIDQIVQKAISTPAVEKGFKADEKKTIGIPQGISISSHLADLYLEDFDLNLKKYCARSYRYVDDVLILYKEYQEGSLESYIAKAFEGLDIEHHKEGSKFYKNDLFYEYGFDFLGYNFFATAKELKASIRPATEQKFINSLIALIGTYRKGRYHLRYQDSILALKVFQYDLNEKITGAFKGGRRYGWLWYFRQMNDLSLLDKVDKIIKRELNKDKNTKKLRVKRLKRTFYEIENFSSNNSYILDYGLTDIGKIRRLYSDMDANIRKAKSDAGVLAAFNHFTNNRLRRLALDEVRES